MSQVMENAWPNGEPFGADRVEAAAVAAGCDEARAAADVAIGRGRGEVVGGARGDGTAGSRFFAESWSRVFTTGLSAKSTHKRASSPHIGFVPVAVHIPAITAAPR